MELQLKSNSSLPASGEIPSVEAMSDGSQVGYGTVSVPESNFKNSDGLKDIMFTVNKESNRRITILEEKPVMFLMHYPRIKGKAYNSYTRCSKSLGYCKICDYIEKLSVGDEKAQEEGKKAGISRKYFTWIIDWTLAKDGVNLEGDENGLPKFELKIWRFGDSRFDEIGKKTQIHGKISQSRDIYVYACKDDRAVQFQQISWDLLPVENTVFKSFGDAIIQKVAQEFQKKSKEINISKIWGKVRDEKSMAERVDFEYYDSLLISEPNPSNLSTLNLTTPGLKVAPKETIVSTKESNEDTFTPEIVQAEKVDVKETVKEEVSVVQSSSLSAILADLNSK